MKILIYSPLFYPSIGGLEAVISMLAHEFVDAGHAVKVVSQTPEKEAISFPFDVIRCPNFTRLLKLTRWCDVYFQGCISLKGIWPFFITPRPFVVTHQTWYRRPDGKLGWQDHLKHFMTHFATNISASHAVADNIPGPSIVIPNSYRDDIFFEQPQIVRNKELVFLGRLVSDKGVDLLLDALARLKQLRLLPRLTIIGSGPEESRLRQQAITLEITEQVNFVGSQVKHELTKLLNAHQILVLPSRWQEPFGIAALEGIACGCVVVGSEGGGLKDAIGPCGVTFPNQDVSALTEVLADLLQNPARLDDYRKSAKPHLSHHQKKKVAQAYLEVFQKAIV